MKDKANPVYFLIFFIFFSASVIRAQTEKENALNKKVETLLSQMTLDEKIGQMTQVDYNAIRSNLNDISKYYIGSILCGGGTEPDDITAKGWANLYDKLQNIAIGTRLKIPIIWGIDAVHGHNNVYGATIFPHNIGLGATRNSKFVEQVASITATEVKGTGMQWDFSPCVAVARNERWGRTYESFSENPDLVKEMATAYVKGMQGKGLSEETSVLACAKHFIGDGGTTDGKDQGNTEVDEATLRRIHLPGYIGALEAGVKSIMVSFSSWNGKKNHENKYLLTDLLKNELGFKGFLVSDWAAIDQLGHDYKKDIEKSINAGLDMIMIPHGPGERNNYIEFITFLKELVNENKVPIGRIDDAASRILKVKYQLGLFNDPMTHRDLTSQVGSAQHRAVAREAVRRSIVLLKNDNNFLPLNKNAKKILVVGKASDDIGIQCGGWTISWQGSTGEITPGTTILQAVKKAVLSTAAVTYSLNGDINDNYDFGIVVVGEMPYAEGLGDRSDLNLSAEDQEMIRKIKLSGIPFVTILISGRPMILGSILYNSNALIAAWLPGTEGEGVTDVLFGDYKPTGKLPFSWPRSMSQIPINIGDEYYDPLFPYGYGLTY